jgi:transposase-like protein
MTELAQVSPALAAAQETEVSAKAKRRRFTAKEKLRILKKADACTRTGELGAMLRSEGIYSSSLSGWRQARERGELDGLAPKRRGPQPIVPDARDKKIAELQRALAKSEAEFKRAEIAIGLQKKVAELFGIQLPKTDEEP